MPSNSILDSGLWIRLDLDSSLKVNTFFLVNTDARAHFASQLLLYDKLIIPTKDFGIIPILISWMGLPTFRDALSHEAIAFVIPQELLGYAGNGNGISGFQIYPTAENPFSWNQATVFGPWQEAPELQLAHYCPFIDRRERSRLIKQIAAASSPIEWDNTTFMANVVNESYTDIISNPVLSDFAFRHEPPSTQRVNLASLSGIAANEFRFFGLDQIRDGIDLVLRVAEINLEIMMAQRCSEADLGTSKGADNLLRAKIARMGGSSQLISSFQRLLELESIPDIRLAISAGDVSVPEIWKLRKKRHARRFRKWLRQAETRDARELEKAYVASLGKSSVFSSLPARALRFSITTAASAANPLLGALGGVVDSFFIDKWLGGYSPRLFLEDIRHLPE